MTQIPVPSSIHFVAMGGSGVLPLARWCQEKGVEVTGSDRDAAKVQALRDLGIRCVEGHRARHLPIGAELLVHSTAVPEANPEIQEARAHGIPVMDRPAFLARLFHSARRGIAITGTHGKTTTTAMVAWILEGAGRDPEAIVGGRVLGWDTGHRAGGGDHFVAEADESNLGYQNLNPEVLVVNNLDHDHVDTYKSLHELEEKALAYMAARDDAATFVISTGKGQRTNRLLEAGLRPGSIVTTSLREPGTLGTGAAIARSHLEGEIVACGPRGVLMRALWFGIPVGEFHLPCHGDHNARNALSAIAVALRLGLDGEEIARGLATFPGVGRRMEHLGHTGFGAVYTDFAHHPTAVTAVLEGLQKRHPGQPITVVLEPHRPSRLEVHWEAFGEALGAPAVAHALILPLYEAGETAAGGVDSGLIVRACSKASRADPEEVAGLLHPDARRVVAFLGAGPVDALARSLAREHALV